jgi:response regulator RpfG family c-di-GMP phosphodiesterase
MFTAHFRAISDVIKYIKAGACDYILKPFSIEELLNSVKRALALEGTINLVTSDPTPLVNKLILMIEAEKLQQENDTLKRQIQQLHTKNLWFSFIIRMIYLLAASLVTVIFYQSRILTNTQYLFFLPIIIFVLLLFPIERVRIFSAKHRETEAKSEVEPNKE